MAINKLVLLLVAALAAPLTMTQAAGGPTIPSWCSCSDNKNLTQTACYRAGGNWDGGSCGVDTVAKFNSFGNICHNLGAMAFNKIVLLLVAILTTLLAMTQAAGAPIIPSWCLCSDNTGKTGPICHQMGGNWDGGSCGITSVAKFWDFQRLCNAQGKPRCWQ
ncbi:hypothetical protein BGZ92_002979 [Podila epicladia]|nr:hypothetical protein BGZ92_002979 [Podila epicladia]